jgi:hypothetical protein
MKICPLGAEFHVGGWTDMTRLIVVFYNFVNTLKKLTIVQLWSQIAGKYASKPIDQS